MSPRLDEQGEQDLSLITAWGCLAFAALAVFAIAAPLVLA